MSPAHQEHVWRGQGRCGVTRLNGLADSEISSGDSSGETSSRGWLGRQEVDRTDLYTRLRLGELRIHRQVLDNVRIPVTLFRPASVDASIFPERLIGHGNYIVSHHPAPVIWRRSINRSRSRCLWPSVSLNCPVPGARASRCHARTISWHCGERVLRCPQINSISTVPDYQK